MLALVCIALLLSTRLGVTRNFKNLWRAVPSAPNVRSGRPGIPDLPVLLPGATCKQALELLGRPTEESEYVNLWTEHDFELTAAKNSKCVLTGIEVRVADSHYALTRDGVALGEDTITDAEPVLRFRMGADSESVEAPEGNWKATITLDRKPGFAFTSTCGAILPGVSIDRMDRDPVFDDFRSRRIAEFSLEAVASPGHDVP
jgi:hypothetical protein